MSARPDLSIVLATHNRRAVVLSTLERLREAGLRRATASVAPTLNAETIVVDNASADGTAEALRRTPDVKLIALDRNLGSCAKALGIERARAPYLLLLDDDSYPRLGCVDRMLSAFEREPLLGAAGFTVHLPDGRQECSALPHVFVGCGVGLRAAALKQAGGLDTSFFMAAEEYDLTFRLLQAGWDCDIFADLQVEHLKTPTGRQSGRLARLDVYNNSRVVARYLPAPAAAIYREEWLLRYRWLAERSGRVREYEQGAGQGLACAARERRTYRRWRLSQSAFEAAFRWGEIEQRMRALRDGGAKRVLLVGFGKNAYAFYRAAVVCGVEVVAIADDAFGEPRRIWRNARMLPMREAAAAHFDACVISDTSYVHAGQRAAQMAGMIERPCHVWFQPPERTAGSAACPAPPSMPVQANNPACVQEAAAN
jgi:GT2 family glycosyltransferase